MTLFVGWSLILAFDPSTQDSESTTPTPPPTPDWLQALDILIWPIVALAALLLLLSPRGVALWQPLVRRLRGFKAAGVELDFTEDSAAQVRESLEKTFESYRSDVKSQFDRLKREHDIDALRNRLVLDIKRHLATEKVWKDVRCTIHVQDLLLEAALYQLLDYFPTGVLGRGRIFPIRFGILGKAWRSRKSQAQGTVSTDPDVLVVDWGMTSEEAIAAAPRGRKSFACVVLRDKNKTPLGVLYFDSNEENAFGQTAQQMSSFLEIVESEAQQSGLTASLEKLVESARKGGPQVRIFDLA